MTDRSNLAKSFLKNTDWVHAESKLLAGDASNRKYYRLTLPVTGETAVLMDAPPSKGEDVRPFLHIAHYLQEIGLSAPRILAEDCESGFLLLEDLGDALFARVALADSSLEGTLYTAATDALIALHSKAPPSGLKSYSAHAMSEMAALSFDWYAAGAGQVDEVFRRDFCSMMYKILDQNTHSGDVLIQRDYHAENLLWLPDRAGVARVGLLDFQDAMLGHRAYDLVSLLQDARRDVSEGIELRMIKRYTNATDADSKAFETAYRCLGAQRNLRILGVFARLCMRDGKSGYVDLIPRVWKHLQHDLAHPALDPIAETLRRNLPEPTPEILQILKDQCATVPNQ